MEADSIFSLKLAGYYFYEFEREDSYSSSKIILKCIRSMFLYKDGTMRYMGASLPFPGTFDKSIHSEINNTFQQSHIQFINNLGYVFYKNDIFGWGHYKVKNDSIFMKFYWMGPLNLNDYRLFSGAGIIKNDTTFTINITNNRKDDWEIEGLKTFKFRHYSPKPDSSNRTQDF